MDDEIMNSRSIGAAFFEAKISKEREIQSLLWETYNELPVESQATRREWFILGFSAGVRCSLKIAEDEREV